MKVITREKFNVMAIDGNKVPVYAYGIEADNYEEAYIMAKSLFDRDYEKDKAIELLNLIACMM